MVNKMNPSIIDNTISADPQCFKVFLRIFIERIRKNRDEDEAATNSKSVVAPPMKNLKKHSQTANTPGRVNQTKFEICWRVTNKFPGVLMSELLNKAPSSSTKSLEEETLQVPRKTTFNHPISTPKEVKVNLKITLDEYAKEVKAEDINDDLQDSSGEEEKESKPSNDEYTNIPDNSSEAREGENKETTHDIDNKNSECAEELEASQVHSLPARSETMEVWESQLESLINKCSEELENKLEEQERDLKSAKSIESEPPTRVRSAGCMVKQEAFQAVIPLDRPSLSKTWGMQFQDIAKKCSQGVKEEPEESAGNEETHINPASQTRGIQFQNIAKKCSQGVKEEPEESAGNEETHINPASQTRGIQFHNIANKCSQGVKEEPEESAGNEETHINPASQTRGIQFQNIANKCSQGVKEEPEESAGNEETHINPASQTRGIQFQNIAKKCSQGVKEEPEESAGNEETHINPASQTRGIQFQNIAKKCSQGVKEEPEESAGNEETHINPASQTRGIQFHNIANKCSQGVKEEPEESAGNEETHINPASQTRGIQFHNIANKCSQGVKEEPEESAGNEETHINPASQTRGIQFQNIAKKCSQGVKEEPEESAGNEETESLTVLESAVGETQCKDDVDTCSVNPEKEADKPIGNLEVRSAHQDSPAKNWKSEAYSFRAVVPPGWHSTLKSDKPISYGWKVASLVKRFENFPQESLAIQRDKIPARNPATKRSNGDQQSSAVKGPTQEVFDEAKEALTTASKASVWESTSTKNERKLYERSSGAVVETSVLQRKAFAKKIQLPDHRISDVTSLVMLNYEKPVYANIPPYADVQIPLAVKDMVLDKFKEDWNRAKQHKIKRDSLRKSLAFRSRSENFIPEYAEILENSLYDEVSEEKRKGCLDKGGSDSGLSRSDATQSSRNSMRSVEACNNTTCGDDQQGILVGATVDKAKSTGDIVNKSDKGGNYYCSITEQSCESLVLDQLSIGSSNISALVSCPARRSGIYSCGSSSSGTRKLPRIPTVASVGYYDGVKNRVDELEREIKIQEEAAKQVSKAVLICRREQKIIKQDIQVEAEKILLVAFRKKDLIQRELILLNSDTPRETQPISVSVSMKNFNFSRAILSPANKQTKKYSWFFVLVLEAGTAVLASEVVKGDSEILFEDSFRFEGKLGDFPIHVKLYALSLKNHKKKNKNRHQMVSVPVPTKGYAPASYFSLWGSSKLRPSRLSKQGQNCFTLTQIPHEASISNTFSVDMKMHLKIMAFKRGFLTVGVEEPNRLPVWNRRWCVLDGAILKYWNYPIEEEVSEPVGQLDLVDARSHKVQLVCKELCPWPKCLSLDIERSESGVKEHFFSADTAEEFNEWQEQLNLVLGHLSKWKSSQEEVECRE